MSLSHRRTRFYFFAWVYLGGNHAGVIGGNQVLAFEDRFKIGAAHDWMAREHGQPCIIVSYQEVTQAEAEEYYAHCSKVHAEIERKKRVGRAPVLSLRAGGKEGWKCPEGCKDPRSAICQAEHWPEGGI